MANADKFNKTDGGKNYRDAERRQADFEKAKRSEPPMGRAHNGYESAANNLRLEHGGRR
jgi:hypothetical protein